VVKKYAHVISHSHWDREWYLPYEKHHVRLIELMDTLLEVFDRHSDFRSFHLDGQTIILEDYLQVRPEKKEVITRLIREGKLIIGPWYILQDEFLTSSEANIRNLLIGHRDAAEYGEVCKLGYFPDSFGNMGQAPQLLRQAGIDTAVFGRGVKPVGFNNEIKGNYESAYSEMNWESPDGSSVLGILFANWYNNGMEVPTDLEEAEVYWRKRLQNAETFASSPHLLFLNGCDHQPVQTDLSAALRTASELYPDVEFIHSNFLHYMECLKKSLPENLSTIRGELRSQRTNGWWTLVNTASARVYIKQANHHSQTLLEKVAEPLAAFAGLLGRPYPHHLFNYGWKTLMQNHPHDSICGCSVDEVHREMMTRFAKSDAIAEEIAQESMNVIGTRIHTKPICWQEGGAVPFVVFNTSGWERTGVVKVVLDIRRVFLKNVDRKQIVNELKETVSVKGRIIDSEGRPIDAMIKDLGVRFGYELPKDKFRQPYMARSIQVTMHISDVPELGYKTYAFIGGETYSQQENRQTNDRSMENEFLSVTVLEDGTYTIVDKRNGRTYSGLGSYEDIGDIGNEYIFRAPESDIPIMTRNVKARVSKVEDTAFHSVMETVHEWEIPAGADEQLERETQEFISFLERTAQRSEKMVPFKITTRLILEKGVPQLKVQTQVWNNAKDHRLRVLFPTDISSPVHRVDSVFEVVERDTIPAPEWTNPSNCQHQQAFVNICDDNGGLTIGNIGLNEYEILRDERGTIAVTLIRAVGELGDWGVFPTPEAQCLGDHTFEYTVIPHTWEGMTRSFESAYQMPIPWTVRQLPIQSGDLPPVHSFLQWSGEGLALTAVKMNEGTDDMMMRWFNMTGEPTSLRIKETFKIQGFYKSNILEERRTELSTDEPLPIRPAEIVTIGGVRVE
jgi:alpha-mannosidase